MDVIFHSYHHGLCCTQVRCLKRFLDKGARKVMLEVYRHFNFIIEPVIDLDEVGWI